MRCEKRGERKRERERGREKEGERKRERERGREKEGERKREREKNYRDNKKSSVKRVIPKEREN